MNEKKEPINTPHQDTDQNTKTKAKKRIYTYSFNTHIYAFLVKI